MDNIDPFIPDKQLFVSLEAKVEWVLEQIDKEREPPEVKGLDPDFNTKILETYLKTIKDNYRPLHPGIYTKAFVS